jgi:hypothetical protein
LRPAELAPPGADAGAERHREAARLDDAVDPCEDSRGACHGRDGDLGRSPADYAPLASRLVA